MTLKDQKWILLLTLIAPIFLFAENTDGSNEKIYVQEYLTNWFSNTNSDWVFNVEGVNFSDSGLEYGLVSLSSNISSLPKSRQNEIKKAFIQNFIDQSIILVKYQDQLINHIDLNLLLQEFFRQAATQLWLEEEFQKDPKAVEPSQEEIDLFMQENSDRLIKMGMSAGQILEYSKQQLQQQKIQDWTAKKLELIRSESDIKINPKFKKKYQL